MNDRQDDWLERGLIRVTLSVRFGMGVVACTNLPLSHKRTEQWLGSITKAPLMSRALAESSDEESVRYVFGVDKERAYDLSTHWTGRINHAPPPLANIRLDGTELYQLRPICAGEELRYEYGLGYWIFQVARYDVEMFDRAQRRVWKRVYLHTDDYGPLLAMRLWEWHPYDVIMQLQQYLRAA